MERFHDILKIKMDAYVHGIYKITRDFPREEIYGLTSQLRRSALSVILNYIEGYARRKGSNCKGHKNFLEIAYGSLKETKYLLHFSMVEKYLSLEKYKKLINLADEIGAMLYKCIN